MVVVDRRRVVVVLPDGAVVDEPWFGAVVEGLGKDVEVVDVEVEVELDVVLEANVWPAKTGEGNAWLGVPARAASMNRFQIRAGRVPPVTAEMPSTEVRVDLSLGDFGSYPIQTAAARLGVYPTNQASLPSEVVPVLPAATRPRASWASGVAVPPLITCSSAYVRSATTLVSMTWRTLTAEL